MRYETAVRLLDLARKLAGSAEGLTLEEMGQELGCSRRTAERMRDAVESAFGALDQIQDGRVLRFRLPEHGLGRFGTSPTSAELVELDAAAVALSERGFSERAKLLRSLGEKVRAALRGNERRRLAPDIEAMSASETIACVVGPRPKLPEGVIATLRHALLAQRRVSFQYPADGGALWQRQVIPYGLLFGTRAYLVGRLSGKTEPVIWRLDRISNLQMLNTLGHPPKNFDLQSYSERSFGVWQEKPIDVVLRFSSDSANEVRSFYFHASQIIEDQTDGGVLVRFHAGSILEMVHHLFTWGEMVTIVAPQELRAAMQVELRRVAKHHGVSMKH